MKQSIFTLIFLLTLSLHSTARQGTVRESLTVASAILGKPVHFAIYLPPDYEESQRPYPVVYLLHGYTDDHRAWLQFGEVDRYANEAIREGTIPPMIIVMPDADSSFYVNSFDGKFRYEDFFFQELIPHIEKSYRVRPERAFRGIAGLSMGGYGSMLYALKHPDKFVAAAPLSAAFFNDSAIVQMPNEAWNMPLGAAYGLNLKGRARLTKSWYSHSIHELIKTKTTEELNKVRYWIDCGDDDFLIEGNCEVHISLVKKRVAHEFRVRDGAHNWTYWRTGIVDALKFIGESFRR